MPDVSYTVGNRDGWEAAAARERLIVDSDDAIGNRDRPATEPGPVVPVRRSFVFMGLCSFAACPSESKGVLFTRVGPQYHVDASREHCRPTAALCHQTWIQRRVDTAQTGFAAVIADERGWGNPTHYERDLAIRANPCHPWSAQPHFAHTYAYRRGTPRLDHRPSSPQKRALEPSRPWFHRRRTLHMR